VRKAEHEPLRWLNCRIVPQPNHAFGGPPFDRRFYRARNRVLKPLRPNAQGGRCIPGIKLFKSGRDLSCSSLKTSSPVWHNPAALLQCSFFWFLPEDCGPTLEDCF